MATLSLRPCAFFPNRAPPRWVDGFSEASRLGRRTIDRGIYRTGPTGTGKLLDVARPVDAAPLELGTVVARQDFADRLFETLTAGRP